MGPCGFWRLATSGPRNVLRVYPCYRLYRFVITFYCQKVSRRVDSVYSAAEACRERLLLLWEALAAGVSGRERFAARFPGSPESPFAACVVRRAPLSFLGSSTVFSLLFPLISLARSVPIVSAFFGEPALAPAVFPISCFRSRLFPICPLSFTSFCRLGLNGSFFQFPEAEVWAIGFTVSLRSTTCSQHCKLSPLCLCRSLQIPISCIFIFALFNIYLNAP